jgi:hypothetical protein
MSDPSGPNQNSATDEPDAHETSGRGPNLTLIYGLVVLAMLAAIVIAAFIVLPFYQRR